MNLKKKFLGLFLSFGLVLIFNISVSGMKVPFNKVIYYVVSKGRMQCKNIEVYKVAIEYNYKEDIKKQSNFSCLVNSYIIFKDLLEQSGLFNLDRMAEVFCCLMDTYLNKEKKYRNHNNFCGEETDDEESRHDVMELIKLTFSNKEEIKKLQKSVENFRVCDNKLTKEKLYEVVKDAKLFLEMVDNTKRKEFLKLKDVLSKGKKEIIKYFIENNKIAMEKFKSSSKMFSGSRKKAIDDAISGMEIINWFVALELKKQESEINFKDNEFGEHIIKLKRIMEDRVKELENFLSKVDKIVKNIEKIKFEEIEDLRKFIVVEEILINLGIKKC